MRLHHRSILNIPDVFSLFHLFDSTMRVTVLTVMAVAMRFTPMIVTVIFMSVTTTTTTMTMPVSAAVTVCVSVE